jgi:hypothetical protein
MKYNPGFDDFSQFTPLTINKTFFSPALTATNLSFQVTHKTDWFQYLSQGGRTVSL